METASTQPQPAPLTDKEQAEMNATVEHLLEAMGGSWNLQQKVTTRLQTLPDKVCRSVEAVFAVKGLHCTLTRDSDGKIATGNASITATVSPRG